MREMTLHSEIFLLLFSRWWDEMAEPEKCKMPQNFGPTRLTRKREFHDYFFYETPTPHYCWSMKESNFRSFILVLSIIAPSYYNIRKLFLKGDKGVGEAKTWCLGCKNNIEPPRHRDYWRSSNQQTFVIVTHVKMIFYNIVWFNHR